MHKKDISSKTKVEIYLREKLKKIAPGDKLPSIRQLKSHFGISQSVVDKAVMQLVMEGLVKVCRPTGLFKAEPVRPVIKLLNFREGLKPHSFYHEFLADLLYRMAESGYRAELVSDPETVHKQLESPDNDMIMTFGANLDDYSLFRRAVHKNIINLLPNFIENISPALIIDDNKLVEIQMKYLHGKGHEKIAYLHLKSDEAYIRAQNCRWDTFHRVGFELNLKFDRRYLINCSERDYNKISEEVCNMLSSENPPTAMLLGSDILAACAYKGIREAGLEPGKDISVLGTDNRSWCEYISPELSSVGFDYDAGFKELIEMAGEIEKGNDGRIIKLPFKIFERESSN